MHKQAQRPHEEKGVFGFLTRLVVRLMFDTAQLGGDSVASSAIAWSLVCSHACTLLQSVTNAKRKLGERATLPLASSRSSIRGPLNVVLCSRRPRSSPSDFELWTPTLSVSLCEVEVLSSFVHLGRAIGVAYSRVRERERENSLDGSLVWETRSQSRDLLTHGGGGGDLHRSDAAISAGLCVTRVEWTPRSETNESVLDALDPRFRICIHADRELASGSVG